MRRQIPVHNGSICQTCGLFANFVPIVRRHPQRSLYTHRQFQPPSRGAIGSVLPHRLPYQLPHRQRVGQTKAFLSLSGRVSSPARPLELGRTPETKHIPNLGELVKSITTFRQHILDIPKDQVVLEQSVVQSLADLETSAGSVVDAACIPPAPTTSALLNLDEDSVATNPSPAAHLAEEPRAATISGPYKDAINLISDTAYRIIAHPNVFISPVVLEKYVRVQSRLGLPETLGHVFELYSSKPMPRSSGNGVKFLEQRPNSFKNAIPQPLADMALDTAIAAKNLDAAVAIIQASYDTVAFRRNKVLRKALIPGTVCALAPVAIYDIASSLAAFQNTMDEGMATYVAFTGILAYVGFTASLGFIATLSSSEQVKRISWALGVPLRYRWVREEQRTAYDKVACAWGFRQSYQFGEETGEDWAALKEYLGQKGMVLDSIELMEGMQ